MHRIDKQVIVEKTVRPNGAEQYLTIDQDAVVLCGDLTKRILERRQTAHRETVEIARHDELVIGFAPVASTFEHLAQPVVSFRETGLSSQERSVAADGLLGA